MKFLNLIKKIKKANVGGAGHNFVGYIDKFDDLILVGWLKKEDEEAPLFVDVFIDDVPIVKKLLASEYRADVKDVGFGSGCYGFSIDLSEHDLHMEPNARASLHVAGTDLVVLSASCSIQRTSARKLTTKVFDEPQNNSISVNHFETLQPEYKVVIDTLTTTSLRGWSVSLADSNRVFALRVLVDGVFYCELRNNGQERRDLVKHGISDGTGGFSIELRLNQLYPGEHVVSVVAPDGTSISKTIRCGEALTGQTELVRKSGEGSNTPVNLWGSSIPFDLAVIIPVYNAAEDLRVCIERLSRFTPNWVGILFINDASTDPEITGILEMTSQYSNMRVLNNESNMGFTRTVNRGLTETGNADVILLNSDARVTPGWVQGLRAAALARPRVGTVTAMSDRAGAFSAPKIGNNNDLPSGVDEITYARAFRRRSAGLYPSVPTGNGFCMYISRACIREIGILDAEAFPKGYGEENDFCMRAGRADWANLVDDRTYVFHDRSKSFGDSKIDLMRAGREVVDRRFPEYKKAISIYKDDPGIIFARYCASQAVEDCVNGRLEKTRVLYVVSTRTGGTPQTNRDLMGAIEDAVDGWLLRCDSTALELSRLVDGEIKPVKYHALSEHVDPISHRSHEYDAVVTEWLLGLDPDIMHIRHLGWHGLSLPQIASQLDIRTVFSFHDFYTLCPNVKLISADQNFCGGVCTKGDADCSVELWRDNSMPRLRDNWVHIWRERFSEVLTYCDAFITTSESAHERLSRHFPHLTEKRFSVIPHGRDFLEFKTVRQTPRPGERIRTLVPGNIDRPKGLDIIEALIAHDKSETLEFHILGDINMRGRTPHPRIVRHGKYARHDFAARAAKVRPHVGAIFSIWDETYCHTLTELWSIGLPALVFDFPTVGGRVRESGAGWVLDHTNIPALYEDILNLVYDPDELRVKAAAVDAWQNDYGSSNTTRVMGASYLQVYRRVLRPEAAKLTKIGVVCPQDATLTDANASTQIRVWERTHNHVNRDLNYIRLHPASLLDLARRREIHGVIIQRNAIPRTMANRLRRVLRDNGIPYIMEIDDDLLNVPEDKDPAGKYKDYAPFLTDLVEDAKAVTVSTGALEKIIRPINPNTVLLPNLLSERLWLEKPVERQRDDIVRALYMGNRTHVEDLKMILPALEDVASCYPMFRLSVVGVVDSLQETLPSFVEIIKVPAEKKTYRKFVPWLREQSGKVDFGIAPLDDNSFNASLSPLKILEYGALGLPTLASDISVYRDLGKKAPHVTLVKNTNSGWTRAITQLLGNGANNRNDGAELRNWVLQNRMLRPSLEAYDEMLKALFAK